MADWLNNPLPQKQGADHHHPQERAAEAVTPKESGAGSPLLIDWLGMALFTGKGRVVHFTTSARNGQLRTPCGLA